MVEVAVFSLCQELGLRRNNAKVLSEGIFDSAVVNKKSINTTTCYAISFLVMLDVDESFILPYGYTWVNQVGARTLVGDDASFCRMMSKSRIYFDRITRDNRKIFPSLYMRLRNRLKFASLNAN